MNMLYQILIAPIEAVMHVVLSAIYGAIGSYGVSIFFLSLLINVVLFPLFQMAERWQEAERKVQKILKPKLQEFRQAFSGEERHAMIHTLYRQAGYHPIYAMRSSFGLFLQLPFWIAAYQLLSQYQPLEGASFLFFEDLGKPDDLLWGINLLPFVMTALNLAGAFVYTKSLRRTEQIQPMVLASLFLVLLYSAPAGLLLYWTFNSLFSLLRIALLDRTQTKDLAPTEPIITTSQKLPPSQASFVVNHAGGTEQLSSASTSALGPTADDSRRKGVRSFDLPLMLSLVLYLVVIAIHAVAHSPRFTLEGGMLDRSQSATIISMRHALLGIGASIVLLAYLCLAFSLKTCHGTKGDLRQQSNVALVWLLFAAVVLVDSAWLSQAYPDFYLAKTTGGILLLLPFLLFLSPICSGIPIVRDMPSSHWLYATSAFLGAFVLFVANPIGLYVSSSDFVGSIYSVAGTFLVLFMAAVLALTALYLLLDKPARNGLTLLSVFSAVSVIVYSIMGVKDGGVMTQFMLADSEGLMRTSYEIVEEIVTLLVMLGAISYATIKHRQTVTYVVGAMLVTSMCVTAADIHGAKGDSIAASKELPVDHVDIVSFSRERNILIIMLDGFPGGYIPEIMDEVPEALREYEGFTWYPNTLSVSTHTLGSIATLAGGPRYGVNEINSRNYESVGSAINESYSVYIDAFVPKGYQVTYANPAFAGGCDRLDQRIHCMNTLPYGLYYHDKEEPDAPLLQGDSHVSLILVMISLLKASPFLLKSRVYDDGDYRGVFPTQVRYSAANTSKVEQGWGFLRVLARESSADSTSKTFKFLQLSIPHRPQALNHDCKLQPEKATTFSESVCALKEIGVLLAWMKETGIYDVTKIVMVSDHGYYIDNPMLPHDFEKVFPKFHNFFSIPGLVQPLLLVKDLDAKGDFRRSETFLSNSDVPSIVCSAVGGCRDVGPDPTANSLGTRRLFFAMVAWPHGAEKAKKYDIKALFEVRDSIFSPGNWTRIK